MHDATSTDAKLMSSADTLRPSTTSESAATSRSPQHDLSLRPRTLRSRLRQTRETLQSEDKQTDTQGESSRITATVGRGIEQSMAIDSATTSDSSDSDMIGRHLAKRQEVTSLDKESSVMVPCLSPGKVKIPEQTAAVELDTLKSQVTLRRRLGMTSRTTRQPGLSKRHCPGHDDVPVFPYQVEYSGSHTQSNTEDKCSAVRSVSRSPPGLDESFRKLVVGLCRIPTCHRVEENSAEETETCGIPQSHRHNSKTSGIPESHRHQHHTETSGISKSHHHRHCTETLGIPQSHHHENRQSSPECKLSHDRRRRLDHPGTCSQVEGEQTDVESEDNQSQLKDCVVVLRRSRSIEKMVAAAHSCPVKDHQISSYREASNHSHRTVSTLEALSSTYLPLSVASVALTSSSSSSLLSSLGSRSEDQRHKLSLRKSPRTDHMSSSPRKNLCPLVLSSGRGTTFCDDRLARNLTSVGDQNHQLSDTLTCGKVGGSGENRHVVPVDVPRHRLKRRKVCLQLTGSHDDGSGLDAEEVLDGFIVGRSATDLATRTADVADVGQNWVISPQPDPDLSSSACTKSAGITDEAVISRTEIVSRPDPDLSLSPTTVKCAKIEEADVGQSEVTAQPDPDSRQPVETNDGTDDEDRVFKGQAKVMSQSDPDLQSSVNYAEMVDHAVINRSEVTPRPDPDLSFQIPVIYVSDESVVGQAEVTTLQSNPDLLQPDLDYRQPIGTTDFSDDRCTDAMYHMALFSSPETSDRDSSPPLPSTPTESFPADSQSSTKQQTTLHHQIDDDDDDDETVGYLSDRLPEAVKPQVKFFDQLKRGVLHRTSDCSADVFSPSAAEIVSTSSRELRDKDPTQEQSRLVAKESDGMMDCYPEESLSRLENSDFDPGHEDVGKKNSDPSPSNDSSVKTMDCDEEKLRSEFLKVGHGNSDISSTPSAEESMRMPHCDSEESSSKPDDMRSDFVGRNSVRKNDIGSTPSERRLILEQSQTLVEADDTSSSFTGNVEVKLARPMESVGIGKYDAGSTSMEEHSVDGTASDTVDSVEDVIVLCPENSPPRRHQVMSDLAVSCCRTTLLQSSYDAFCSDAGDLPSRPRYVMMLGVYKLPFITFRYGVLCVV